MMKKNYRRITFSIGIVSIVAFATHASAAPLLTVTLSGEPLSVATGQIVTVNVALTGLSAGEELDSLGATIAYDGALLSPPTISLGDILPNPLDDPSDALTVEAAGLADVSFLTFGLTPASHITSNGLFFSVSLDRLGSVHMGNVG